MRGCHRCDQGNRQVSGPSDREQWLTRQPPREILFMSVDVFTKTQSTKRSAPGGTSRGSARMRSVAVAFPTTSLAIADADVSAVAAVLADHPQQRLWPATVSFRASRGAARGATDRRPSAGRVVLAATLLAGAHGARGAIDRRGSGAFAIAARAVAHRRVLVACRPSAVGRRCARAPHARRVRQARRHRAARSE